MQKAWETVIAKPRLALRLFKIGGWGKSVNLVCFPLVKTRMHLIR